MWPEAIHRELAAAKIRVVGYVPDGGHKRLIELCQADKSMRAVVLTTDGNSHIRIFDILGRQVRDLTNDFQTA